MVFSNTNKKPPTKPTPQRRPTEYATVDLTLHGPRIEEDGVGEAGPQGENSEEEDIWGYVPEELMHRHEDN